MVKFSNSRLQMTKVRILFFNFFQLFDVVDVSIERLCDINPVLRSGRCIACTYY